MSSIINRARLARGRTAAALSKRRRLCFESLETRALLAALTPGNILVASAPLGQQAKLFEFTAFGEQVQELAIPPSGVPAEEPRDIVVDANGKVQIFNGMMNPQLTTFDVVDESFTNTPFDGWSTLNSSMGGGIAAVGDFVFATDMRSGGAGAPMGVLRFDINTLSGQRFATDFDPLDVNMGLDGMLYVLQDSRVGVFDPTTLAKVREVILPRGHQAIAVDSIGHIFAVHPDIYHYDENGELIGAPMSIGVRSLTDIDIDLDNRILVSTPDGKIAITNRDFVGVTTFSARLSDSTTFTAFVSGSRGLPRAENDSFDVLENSSDNELLVLDNDVLDDEHTNTITAVGATSNGGTVTIVDNVALEYTPKPDFVGVETFTYTLTDEVGGSDQAVVSVAVKAVGGPQAVADDYETVEDSTLDVPAADGLLKNDLSERDSFGGLFDPQNFVIQTGVDCCTSEIIEYTRGGTRVQSVAVPSFGSFETTRGVAFDRNGNVQIYNGSATPRLSTYNTLTQDFTHTLFAGWSTSGFSHWGRLAAFRDFMFATDTQISGEPSGDRGIVRFDVRNHTADRFAADFGGVNDLTIGLDGFLYALVPLGSVSGFSIEVFDPLTMTHSHSIPIGQRGRPMRSIVVDTNGQIYGIVDDGSSQDVFEFDSAGNEIRSLTLEMDNLVDMDVRRDGQIIVASANGQVAITDTFLDSFTTLDTPTGDGNVHVAFVEPPVGLGFGDLTVQSFDQPNHGTVNVESDGAFVYTPSPDFAGEDQFTYTIIDEQDATDEGIVTITVEPVNDAPILLPGDPSSTTNEDTTKTHQLPDFVNNGEKTSDITDIDQGDVVGGLAVNGADGPGVWRFALPGGLFQDLGDVSDTNALLLPFNAQVQFIPDGLSGGTATLDYRAWDETTGDAGDKVDVSANGGVTAFSIGEDTLTITVEEVNDPPSDITLSPSDVDENATGAVIGTLTVEDPDENDTHTFELSDSRFETDGNELQLKSTAFLDFESEPSVTITVTAKDAADAEVSRDLAIQVNDRNDPPVVANPIPDASVFVLFTFDMVFGNDTFSDEDAGQSLTYSASLTSGDLPPWLSFVPEERRFIGTPQAGDVGVFDVVVRATDSGSPPEDVTDTFQLEVKAHPFDCRNPVNPLDVNQDNEVTPADALIPVNYLNSNPGTTDVPEDCPPYLDVNGDNHVTPSDPLLVVNALNNSDGEGEALSLQEPFFAEAAGQSEHARSDNADPALIAPNVEAVVDYVVGLPSSRRSSARAIEASEELEDYLDELVVASETAEEL